jgi:hypothetical protein
MIARASIRRVRSAVQARTENKKIFIINYLIAFARNESKARAGARH